MSACAFCQKEVDLQGKPGRRDTCPHCGVDLHCCFQCRFYDPNAHHHCLEPQAEYVGEKGKANFCDYFVFEPKTKRASPGKDILKSKWEGLFKKK